MFDAVFIIYKKIIYVIQQVTVAPTLYPRAIHALPGDVALLEMIRIGPANVPLNAQTATIVAPTTLIYAAELVQQVITLPLSLYLLLGPWVVETLKFNLPFIVFTSFWQNNLTLFKTGTGTTIRTTTPGGGAGSCAGRCGQSGTDATKPCQCNLSCQTYGDCCSDFQDTCNSCQGRCSAAYNKLWPCQCNIDCPSYGNCCNDYNELCLAGI